MKVHFLYQYKYVKLALSLCQFEIGKDFDCLLLNFVSLKR
jgi:hypothetical protein